MESLGVVISGYPDTRMAHRVGLVNRMDEFVGGFSRLAPVVLLYMTTDFDLWKWSLITQLVSGLLIAGFFLVYGRAFRTAEMRAWTGAWVANLAALLVTLVDVYLVDAKAGPVLMVIFATYIVAKACFVMFVFDGVRLATHRPRALGSARTRLLLLGGIALLTAFTVQSFTALGLLAQAIVGVGLLVCVSVVLPRLREPVGWLSFGLVVRALLGLAEVVAYANQAAPASLPLPFSPTLLASLLAVSSFFDTIAEWLLALGCVMAATSRAQRELASSNADLLGAQEALRNLVDVDPLTGLANRRALAGILRDVQPHGATLVFCDLHNFKQINDVHGHVIGDAVLQRFASALRESFRPEDYVVRYAGDEFLVIARGLDSDAIMARVDTLRLTLALSATEPRIQFDAGHATLQPRGMPDEAIRAADQAMYEAKERTKRSRAGTRV
jgi:diguanylate cyclase (GGDEF)-like protein